MPISHIKILHDNETTVIHGQTVGRDGARTLCGEDTSGDDDRQIIGDTKEKITCTHCIELIVGIHRFFSLTDLDPKSILNSKSATVWIEDLAKKD